MPHYFNYQDSELYAEKCSLLAILRQVGTPCYVYSRAMIEAKWHEFRNAFTQHPHLICYAVKANSNLAILDILKRLGAGFDIVSMGELERVLHIGADPKKIVFSGVGKTEAEIRRALDIGIYCFNVESVSELYRIETIAMQLKKTAPIALRVNPDIDAHTHPYISTGLRENKFGIDIENIIPLFEYAAQSLHLNLLGIDCHIGSQLTELDPIADALQRINNLVAILEKKGIDITHINMGGGIGIRYKDEKVPSIQDYVALLKKNIINKKVIIEPGRSIVGNAGVLLTRIEYIKKQSSKNFAIVDAGMNDLMRPAMYHSYHAIQPLMIHNQADKLFYDVVGPICETSDSFAIAQELAVKEGDYLAIRDVGAYGFSMSSQYNSRPRAVEIMVDGEKYYQIRRRENYGDLYSAEKIICD